ncbi:MMPL domain protein [Thiorhodococcus drewsii AZ1]|uniref:MMPL domain protein n=1 Tax=Thiorhodococcus drewsii AZ1 TaxID=765913 RepID=G2E484_9GAMM|nr:MMPL family transporter [Thiorhodococcus drewsii]EGV29811.1 MMPL domain protein [Thiorhodococcus drewsii AZ1]
MTEAKAGLAALLVRYRWWALVLLVLLTVFLASQWSHLYTEHEDRALMPGDRAQQTLDDFWKTFGNDDFIYILVDTEGVLDPAVLERLETLAVRLRLDVPYLRRLTWLGNAEQVIGVPDGIEVRPLMERIPEQGPRMDALRERIAGDPQLLDNLISRDGRTAALLLELDDYPEDTSDHAADPRGAVAEAVPRILADFPDLTTYAVGGPIINATYSKIAAQESASLGLFTLGLMVVLLALTTRSLSGVLIPFTVILVSLVWTFGIIGMLGGGLSELAIMLPILLICVGIGDSMHFVAEQQRRFRLQGAGGHEALNASILETWRRVLMPISLTSLTTAVGFLAFLTIAIVPIREIGLQAALGVVVALIVSVTLTPILASFSRSRRTGRAVSRTDGGRDRIDGFHRLLAAAGDLAVAHPRRVLAAFLAVSALSLAGYAQVETETNSVKDFAPDHPLRQAYEYVDRQMGGSMALEVVLDSGRSDGIKDPAFLRQMEALQTYIDDHRLTRRTDSILDAVKRTRQALNGSDPAFYRLPETRRQAAELLFLYETGGGALLDRFVGFDYDRARLRVRTQGLSTADVHRFIADVDRFVQSELSSDIQVTYTGTMAMIASLAGHIVRGQQSSFLAAFSGIALLLILVLRSLRLGLIAMVPNLFPVLLALGVMGLVGIHMHMMLMILAPIVIAVSVDDTIHFFYRFRLEFLRTPYYAQAIHRTLVSVGRPLLFTTLVLSIGFSVLSASSIDTLNDFGLLSSCAFVGALIADLLLGPALLVLLKPLGEEGGRREASTALGDEARV